MNNRVRVLDCTLRDGGYVNNWDFGEKNVSSILNKLTESNIDLIECGFLSKKKERNSDSSIFNDLEEINPYIYSLSKNIGFACMINYGEVEINDIAPYKGNGIDILRIAFHKTDLANALDYCSLLKEKGYRLFIQPMVTGSYTENELDFLIEKTNEISPEALYIVDSFGTMRKKELIAIFARIDTSLDKKISIGFHSHNNLQLSFPNAQELIQEKSERSLIIDSSIFGMGRGAGNLCTELLTMYLNESFNTHYKLLPILEAIDEFINPIFIQTPWGYSVPYYVASVNNCHPNYASYLVNKQTLGVKDINFILSQIPQEKKQLYDIKEIETLYLKFQEFQIDDKENLEQIRKLIGDNDVLILAPGKTIKTHKEIICSHIGRFQPIVFSVNFIPEDISFNALFLSNIKRFSSIDNLQEEKEMVIIATSNITKNKNFPFLEINYTSLINPAYEEMDNAGIMLLRLLKKIGVKKISIAGYDGFNTNPHDNYYSESFINNTNTEIIEARNSCISKQIKEIGENVTLDFLTPSIYVHNE